MPRTRPSAQPSGDLELDAFAQQVEQVLEHCDDPKWIGEQSPLAAPYFLGRALVSGVSDMDASQRGHALLQAMRAATAPLEAELRQLLLQTYFERDPAITKNIAVALKLNLSERTFYRLRLRAISELAQALNDDLLPPLRSEAPTFGDLVGREAALKQAVTALQAGRSVSLTGPSGIGKTLLGATAAQQWATAFSSQSVQTSPRPARPVFWYTLRSRLNDTAANLLFALGFFLRGLNASSTWRQLVADRGVPDLNRALALLRHDLNSLSDTKPLICVDELDALQDDAGEHINIGHVLEESHAQSCPCLFISQRVTMQADDYIKLAGMSLPDLSDLLQQLQVSVLTVSQGEQLLEHTRGNPAMIHLFAGLLRDGDNPEVALRALGHSPSLEGLFNRIWRRLAVPERTLLSEIAVFPTPAPEDAWSDRSKLLERLRQRELVVSSSAGSVQVMPHIQRFVYERIPLDRRQQLHLQAASVRSARAEHLGFLYHAVEGQHWSWAIWQWRVYGRAEIDRGQGTAALELLSRIPVNQLSEQADRTALLTARAELLERAGRHEEADNELRGIEMPPDGAELAYLRRLEGSIAEQLNRIDQALRRYRESVDALSHLPPLHAVLAHNRLTYLQLYRLNDVEQARKEALLARAKADDFLGDVESMAGNYDAAISYLMSAKKYAEEAGSDLNALALVYSHLGTVYVKFRDYDTALIYIDQAIECERQRGDSYRPLFDLLNRTTALNLSGRCELGYAEAQAGLKRAEQFKNSFLISGLAACVAEACYGLERFDEAEHYSNYSMNQEEEYFFGPSRLLLGKIRLKQGRFAVSLSELQQALAHARTLEDRYTEVDTLFHIALAHLKQGSLDDARAAFRSARELDGQHHVPDELKDFGQDWQAWMQSISR